MDLIDVSTQSGKIAVIVKPNSKRNQIIGYNETKSAWLVAVKATPEDNKANKELVRYLTKTLKKKVSIKSGFTSKTKILEIN